MPQWSLADATTQHRWLAELKAVADQIYPGLDYSREIITTVQREQGPVWVLEQDSLALGASIVWHQGTREGSGEDTAVLQLAVLDPEETTTENFHALIQASETGAALAGKETLVIPVNTSHTWALDQLLSWGYRVERLAVRMVRKDFPLTHTAGRLVDLNRWAG